MAKEVLPRYTLRFTSPSTWRADFSSRETYRYFYFICGSLWIQIQLFVCWIDCAAVQCSPPRPRSTQSQCMSCLLCLCLAAARCARAARYVRALQINENAKPTRPPARGLHCMGLAAALTDLIIYDRWKREVWTMRLMKQMSTLKIMLVGRILDTYVKATPTNISWGVNIIIPIQVEDWGKLLFWSLYRIFFSLYNKLTKSILWSL